MCDTDVVFSYTKTGLFNLVATMTVEIRRDGGDVGEAPSTFELLPCVTFDGNKLMQSVLFQE